MPAAYGAIGVPVDRGVIVSMQVNCPWSDDHPRGIKDFCSIVGVNLADFSDLTIGDADISLERRYQRPINNRSAFNDGIKLWHNALLVLNPVIQTSISYSFAAVSCTILRRSVAESSLNVLLIKS